MGKEEGDECLMDCQYQYVPLGDPDYYGFLLDHTGQCPDPLVKKGIAGLQIIDSRLKDPWLSLSAVSRAGR